jgi:hypothetical protein
MHKKRSFLGNLFAVLLGMKSWVGYEETKGRKDDRTPTGLQTLLELSKNRKLKKGVFSPAVVLGKTATEELTQKAKQLYAEDYDWTFDIRILLAGMRS